MYVCKNSQSELVASKVFYKKKRERSESKKSEKLPISQKQKEEKEKKKKKVPFYLDVYQLF